MAWKSRMVGLAWLALLAGCSEPAEENGGEFCLSPPDYAGAMADLSVCQVNPTEQKWCSGGETLACAEGPELAIETVANDCCLVAHPDIEMTVEEVRAPEGGAGGTFAADVTFQNVGNSPTEVSCVLFVTGVVEANLDCDGALLVSEVNRLPESYDVAVGENVPVTIEVPVETLAGAGQRLYTLECRGVGEPTVAVTSCFRAICRDGVLVDDECQTANNYQVLGPSAP